MLNRSTGRVRPEPPVRYNQQETALAEAGLQPNIRRRLVKSCFGFEQGFEASTEETSFQEWPVAALFVDIALNLLPNFGARKIEPARRAVLVAMPLVKHAG